MKESIKKIASYVLEDVEKIRNENNGVSNNRIGVEVMVLNALCNAERALTEKCQSK